MPKYAPELNDIEVVWRDLKAHHLAHQTFTDDTALDQAIHAAVQDLDRMVVPLAKASEVLKGAKELMPADLPTTPTADPE